MILPHALNNGLFVSSGTGELVLLTTGGFIATRIEATPIVSVVASGGNASISASTIVAIICE